jgi:hypothetical protein
LKLVDRLCRGRDPYLRADPGRLTRSGHSRGTNAMSELPDIFVVMHLCYAKGSKDGSSERHTRNARCLTARPVLLANTAWPLTTIAGGPVPQPPRSDDEEVVCLHEGSAGDLDEGDRGRAADAVDVVAEEAVGRVVEECAAGNDGRRAAEAMKLNPAVKVEPDARPNPEPCSWMVWSSRAAAAGRISKCALAHIQPARSSAIWPQIG